jgi:hypothetical protein
MCARQPKQQRLHPIAAEQHGHRDAQPAPHFAPPGIDHRLAHAQFVQRAQAAFIIDLPILSKALGSGGAVEQPHAQPRLHPRDRLAHRRPGERQPIGRASEAAAFDDLHEYLDSIEIGSHAHPGIGSPADTDIRRNVIL